MKRSSRVSIIVPVYDVEEYLGTCLDSLIHQTLQDIEIICVNDGSNDKSLDIMKEYQQKDSRIKVIDQRNGGLSAARNAGFKAVSSPYVMFCDPDDSYDLEMCRNMVEAVEKNDVDLAVCGINMIYEAHEEMKMSDENYYRLWFEGKKLINDKVILDTNGSACNKIYKMDIIEKNNIRFPVGLNSEDHCFYCEYMSASSTIYFLNRKLYNYVRRENSIMSNNFDGEKLSVDDIKVAEKIFQFYKKTGFLEKHRNLFWIQWTGGFWASYRYSGDKYHKDVLKLGKEFIEKNYAKYKPQNPRIQKIVNEVADYSMFYRLKELIKNILKRCYLKVNFAYKQQEYINVHFEEIYEKYRYIHDCLENLSDEEKDNI